MSEWKETTLQDVVSKLGDGLHGTPKYDVNGEYYFINGNNLSNGKILIKESTKKTSLSEYIKHRRDLNDRTILVSINGTLGNVALYNNEKCFLGKSACYFNVKEDVDKLFIKYVVTNSHFQRYIDVFANGTTIKNVSLKTMREYPLSLPPLAEQRAIAGVLSALDDKIDLLHRQNKTLEAMAETLFRQWFVEEAQPEWEEVALGEFVNIQSGFAFKSRTFTENGKYQLVTIKNVQDGVLNLDKTSKLNEIPARMPDYCHLVFGDILLSLTGNVGRCCLVTESDLLLNQRVAKLQPRNKADWAFVYTLFRREQMKNLLQDLAQGTAQANLSPIETANTEVGKPPQKQRESFSVMATPLLEKVLENKNQIRTLESLRDTLLPKLMSGQVRVQYDKERQ